jgi:hypothetical protein
LIYLKNRILTYYLKNFLSVMCSILYLVFAKLFLYDVHAGAAELLCATFPARSRHSANTSLRGFAKFRVREAPAMGSVEVDEDKKDGVGEIPRGCALLVA